MAIYTRRVQTVLSDEQLEALNQLADDQGKPVSVLIREAIEGYYFKQATLERRREALATLTSLNAPVADWQEMENEITRGALGE